MRDRPDAIDPALVEAGAMESKGHRPLIVVGVDGSESSRYALRWAARQAECADADVRAVMAWHLPEIYSYEPRDYEADALGALDDVVKETLGSNPRVPVVTQVVAGDAAPVLIAASRDAELLVVGSHGHGGFRGMLLGSVSQHCVSHAHCPVVVARRREL